MYIRSLSLSLSLSIQHLRESLSASIVPESNGHLLAVP